MYVGMYTYTYTHILYIDMKHIYTYRDIYRSLGTYAYACAYTCLHLRFLMCTYIQVEMYVCVYIYRDTYTQRHTCSIRCIETQNAALQAAKCLSRKNT